MPYIQEYHKKRLADNIPPRNPGELNYLITKLLLKYWKNSLANYQSINDIIGALECAKQEFYRRIVISYEEKKIKENGDCY